MSDNTDKGSKLCECGCGKYTKPGNRFIVGHNGRGVKVSDIVRKKISETVKKQWENPLRQEKQSELTVKQWKNPLIRKKMVEGQKKGWKNPLIREKRLKSQIKRWEDPSEHEKQSETQMKRWENLSEREKMSKAQKKRFAEIDNPGLEIVKHHIAYDFNNPNDLIVEITSSFHGSIHHPKGCRIGERGYSLID